MIKLGIALTGSAIMLSSVGYCTFLLFDRASPVIDSNLKAMPDIVTPGTSFHLSASLFYLRSCGVVVRRSMYDKVGQPYSVPELVLPAPPTGISHSSTLISLPLAFPEGEGRIVSKPVYVCNFMQRLWPIAVEARVVHFVAKLDATADVAVIQPSK